MTIVCQRTQRITKLRKATREPSLVPKRHVELIPASGHCCYCRWILQRNLIFRCAPCASRSQHSEQLSSILSAGLLKMLQIHFISFTMLMKSGRAFFLLVKKNMHALSTFRFVAWPEFLSAVVSQRYLFHLKSEVSAEQTCWNVHSEWLLLLTLFVLLLLPMCR